MIAPRTLLSGTIALALLAVAIPLHAPSSASAALAAKKTCSAKAKKTNPACKKRPTPTPTKTPTPKSYATRAASLVAAYTSASTQAARIKAIEAMLAALNVTVYGPSGTPVVRGAGDKNTPYLLEIEVRELDGRLQAGATTSPADLAHDLQLVGVQDAKGAPVSPDALVTALEAGTREAVSHPTSPTSLAPLLIRQLGLRHTPAIDTAGNASASQITLDPLQRFLFSASVLIPWSISAHHTVQARSVTRQSAPTWLFGGPPNGPSPIEQALGDLLPAGSPPTLADLSVWFQAQMLKTVHLDIHPEIETALETHYGPVAHDGDGGLAGKTIDFKLYAGVSDPIASDADCITGWAVVSLGAICSLSALENMDPGWGDSGITEYGTLSPSPGDDSARVVAHRARLSLTPYDEAVPGMGPLKVATGVVTASPKVAERLGIREPKLVAFLDGEYANMQYPWKVSYHEPRGFMFSGMTIRYHIDYPQVVNNMYHSSEDIVDTYSGHVCADRPNGHNWWIHLDRQITWHKLNGESGTQNLSSDTTWQYLYELKFGDENAEPAMYAQVIPPATSGGPYQVYVGWQAPKNVSYTTSPASGTVTVPVQEDTSCP